MTGVKLPRGIRNNNPGNIDHNPNFMWKGELPFDASIEPRFCRFKTPEDGLRAICKIILTYQRKYKTCSVQGVINRWAPPSENDTKAYVKEVAHDIGVEPTGTILLDYHLIPLCKAIVMFENRNLNPYTEAQYLKASLDAKGL